MQESKTAERSQLVRLFLISFAALAFEILLIRWIASEIRVFAYFKNFVLMACFLGLGVGCAFPVLSAEKKKPGLAFPILILVISVITATATMTDLSNISLLIDRDVFDFNVGLGGSHLKLFISLACVYGMFMLVTATFDALGRQLGSEFIGLPPLPAYTANLLGSFAGVAAFSIASLLELGPVVWLAVSFLPLLSIYWPDKKRLAVFVACAAASMILAGATTAHSIWSAYYRIDTIDMHAFQQGDGSGWVTVPYTLGTDIQVNHSPHQQIINLSDDFIKQHPEIGNSTQLRVYNLPFGVMPHPKNVLILGAGTGNDVSGALRNGAQHVDAVEIDPAIQKLGVSLHPEKPYADPRVTVHFDDARAFIAASKEKYPLIIFGHLDSQTALSTMSSVRLDNYLYTKDSLKAATEHLTPDGIACLGFAAQPDWLRARLFQMAAEVYPQSRPLALNTKLNSPNSITVIWGPGLDAIRGQLRDQFRDIIADEKPLAMSVEIPTDDWPFLYQRARTLPFLSLIILISVVGISAMFIYMRFKLRMDMARDNLQFFLLGAGFLLMETRAMLVGAIVFASTWMVNSTIISLVLLMALASTWLVMKSKWPTQTQAYIGLFAALLVMYFFPLNTLIGAPLAVKAVGASLVLGLPFLFSGIVFARAFATAKEPSVALGVNILGAILGGCLEYLCVIMGGNGLIILAIAIYGLSFFARRKDIATAQQA